MFQITVNCKDANEVSALLQKLGGAVSAPVPGGVPGPAVPVVAGPAPAAAPAAPPPLAPVAAAPVAPTGAPGMAEVNAAIAAHAGKFGGARTAAQVARFGVKSAKELPPERFPELIAILNGDTGQ